MNIVSIKTIFPAAEIPAVIPVERPTVPNAETASNSSGRNSISGSVRQSRYVETRQMIIDVTNIKNALKTVPPA